MICKNCGGNLSLDKQSKYLICDYCGRKELVSSKKNEYRNLENNYILEGKKALNQEEWYNAELNFNKAIELDFEEGEAYIGVLMCQYHSKNFGDFIDKCKQHGFDGSKYEIEMFEKAIKYAVYPKKDILEEIMEHKTILLQNKQEKFIQRIEQEDLDNLEKKKVGKVIVTQRYEEITPVKNLIGIGWVSKTDNGRYSFRNHKKIDFIVAVQMNGDIMLTDKIIFDKHNFISDSCSIYPNFNEFKDIKKIFVKRDIMVGIKNNGTAIGVGSFFVNREPLDWENISEISIGDYHIVGLKEDGRVVATGDFSYGRCAVLDWTEIVSISAGSAHTVGLRADGSVIATGRNDDQQCNVSHLYDIMMIACGNHFTAALRTDGSVVIVGKIHEINTRSKEINELDWRDIIYIVADGEVIAGIKVDGTVIVNIESMEEKTKQWTNIVDLQISGNTIIGLRKDGTLLVEPEMENKKTLENRLFLSYKTFDVERKICLLEKEKRRLKKNPLLWRKYKSVIEEIEKLQKEKTKGDVNNGL